MTRPVNLFFRFSSIIFIKSPYPTQTPCMEKSLLLFCKQFSFFSSQHRIVAIPSCFAWFRHAFLTEKCFFRLKKIFSTFFQKVIDICQKLCYNKSVKGNTPKQTNRKADRYGKTKEGTRYLLLAAPPELCTGRLPIGRCDRDGRR